MAKIVVVGGGLVGMASASLLGKDGHDVLVLERDSAPTPSNAEDAWASWERRGVGQFRQAYGIAPRLTPLLEEELPEINRHLERLGAYRWNFTSQLDPALPERRKLMEDADVSR